MLSLDSFLKKRNHSDVGNFSLIRGKCRETLSLWVLAVKIFLGWCITQGFGPLEWPRKEGPDLNMAEEFSEVSGDAVRESGGDDQEKSGCDRI
jgi:hypothetical protein